MSDEQTRNTNDRSTQVEEIITELANCRGVPPSLFRKIVCLAELAQKQLDKQEYDRQYRVNERGSRTTSYDIVRSRTTGIYREDTLKKDKKVSKNISLPEDFSPNKGWAMKKVGWDEARADLEAERFRNHYLANGKKHKDWNRTWMNWVISPFQQRSNGNGTSSYTRQPTKKERLGDLMQTLGSGKFWEDFTRHVPQRDDTGGEVVRGVNDRNIHYLPVRSGEGGSESDGDSNGSPDFFALDRPNKRMAEE